MLCRWNQLAGPAAESRAGGAEAASVDVTGPDARKTAAIATARRVPEERGLPIAFNMETLRIVNAQHCAELFVFVISVPICHYLDSPEPATK
jgi:hypothetical protein